MDTGAEPKDAKFAMATAVGLVTFAAAAWGAYPQGFEPVTVALLAGGCALIPFGLTLAFTGAKRVGAVVSCVGLVVAGTTQAPSLVDQLRPEPSSAPPSAQVQLAPSPSQGPRQSEAASDKPKSPNWAPKTSQLAQPEAPSASSKPIAVATGTTVATSPSPSPSHGPVRRPRSVSFVGFDMLDESISQATPTIGATVSGGPDGSQRVTVNMGSLGRGPIEWSLLKPDGGTLTGGSFASPQDSSTRTYDLHPPVAGIYELTVANKVTGRRSSNSVALSQDTREPILVAAPAPSDPAVNVASSDGALCKGTNVTLQLSDVGADATLHLDLIGAGTAVLGVATDSVGAGVVGFRVTSDVCTGVEETAATMSVTDAAGIVVVRVPLILHN